MLKWAALLVITVQVSVLLERGVALAKYTYAYTAIPGHAALYRLQAGQAQDPLEEVVVS